MSEAAAQMQQQLPNNFNSMPKTNYEQFSAKFPVSKKLISRSNSLANESCFSNASPQVAVPISMPNPIPQYFAIEDQCQIVPPSPSLVQSNPDSSVFPINNSMMVCSNNNLTTNNDRVYTTDIKYLRSNASEPNLFEFHSVNKNPRKNSFSNSSMQNQTIMISNTSGMNSNQIILKSSCSDQNLTANMTNYGDSGQMFDYSIRSFANEARPLPTFTQPVNNMIANTKYNECFPGDINTLPRSSGRKLPQIPAVRRNQTICCLPMPFEHVPLRAIHDSKGGSDSNVDSGISSDQAVLKRGLSLESPTEPIIDPRNMIGRNPLSRSHSLIAEDQVIDIEYDSDTGWITKNVIKKNEKPLSYGRESMKLDLHSETEQKEKKKLISRRTRSLSRNVEPKDSSTSSSNSATAKGSTKKVKQDLNFNEVEFKNKSKLKKASDKMINDPVTGSGDSIGSIIDEVRTELMQKPRKFCFLSDESPTGIHRSISTENLATTTDRKKKIEGQVVGTSERGRKSGGKQQYVCEKAIGFERTQSNEEAPGKIEKSVSPNKVFTKCRSRSSIDSHENVENVAKEPKRKEKETADDSGDDVFDTPFIRGRNSSFHGKSKSKTLPKDFNPNRRSSSLEALPSTRKTNSRKSSDSKSTRNSSVSINETPEYFEYPKGSSSKSCSAKNSNSDGIALLHTKPTRGSLKKSSTASATKSPAKKTSSTKISTKSSTKKPAAAKKPSSNSDYEVRDRGRSRRGGGGDPDRESLRKGDRATDRNAELESSDRESTSQTEGILNRSLSNAEGNLEDRIGECVLADLWKVSAMRNH